MKVVTYFQISIFFVGCDTVRFCRRRHTCYRSNPEDGSRLLLQNLVYPYTIIWSYNPELQ